MKWLPCGSNFKLLLVSFLHVTNCCVMAIHIVRGENHFFLYGLWRLNHCTKMVVCIKGSAKGNWMQPFPCRSCLIDISHGNMPQWLEEEKPVVGCVAGEVTGFCFCPGLCVTNMSVRWIQTELFSDVYIVL